MPAAQGADTSLRKLSRGLRRSEYGSKTTPVSEMPRLGPDPPLWWIDSSVTFPAVRISSSNVGQHSSGALTGSASASASIDAVGPGALSTLTWSTCRTADDDIKRTPYGP